MRIKQPTKKMRKQAVAVAEDVLASLGKLVPSAGSFVKNYELPPNFNKLATANEQAQALKPACRVCALGACFLSTVTLYNAFEFKFNRWPDRVIVGDENMFNRLRAIFTPVQLYLIENAFENGNGYFRDNINLGEIGLKFSTAPDRTAAVKFGRRFKTATTRLRAIMKNIVANEGVFIP